MSKYPHRVFFYKVYYNQKCMKPCFVSVEYKFVRSLQKDTKLLWVQGYTFCFQSKSKYKTRWVCSSHSSKKCNAVVFTTFDNQIIKIKNIHTHSAGDRRRLRWPRWPRWPRWHRWHGGRVLGWELRDVEQIFSWSAHGHPEDYLLILLLTICKKLQKFCIILYVQCLGFFWILINLTRCHFRQRLNLCLLIELLKYLNTRNDHNN